MAFVIGFKNRWMLVMMASCLDLGGLVFARAYNFVGAAENSCNFSSSLS